MKRWRTCPNCREAQPTIDPATNRCQNCGWAKTYRCLKCEGGPQMRHGIYCRANDNTAEGHTEPEETCSLCNDKTGEEKPQ